MSAEEYRKYFLGTARLLQLTNGLDDTRKNELLTYISKIEDTLMVIITANRDFAEKVNNAFNIRKYLSNED